MKSYWPNVSLFFFAPVQIYIKYEDFYFLKLPLPYGFFSKKLYWLLMFAIKKAFKNWKSIQEINVNNRINTLLEK